MTTQTESPAPTVFGLLRAYAFEIALAAYFAVVGVAMVAALGLGAYLAP